MKFALVAGEASGDLLGAGLIRAIAGRVHDATFEGVAGPAMLAAGCKALEDADALAVMGLVEPLKRLPKLLKLRRSLARHWITNPPDVFIGIDAPDFNLGLEKKLKRAGVATAHYVSPSVWAWRQGRVRKIRQACDVVLCLLPFETSFYDDHAVEAVFVGHPKADTAPATVDTNAARAALGIRSDAPVVAVLPGSRSSEVSRLGPLFAAAAERIGTRVNDVQFVTPVAATALRPMIEQYLADSGVRTSFTLLDGDSDTAMKCADVVMLASGTAALEAALLTKPTVAAYQFAALTAAIFRAFRLVKIDRFTIPNLLTKSPYIPEFIQEAATPQALADAVIELLQDDQRRRVIAARFSRLRVQLAQGANERAAAAVLSLTTYASS